MKAATFLQRGLTSLWAMCQMLAATFAQNVVSAAESFEDKDDRMYKAKFGEESDLLSSAHGGWCLTGRDDGCLDLATSFENLMVIGGIGSGKTASIVIPSALMIKNASLIINCPSGQTRSRVAAALAQEGVEIQVLKFDDPHTSSNFNPLAFTKNRSDAHKLAHALSSNLKPGSGDNFWQLQTTILLFILISIVITQPPEFQTMANVKFLLNRFASDVTSLDKLFIKFASAELIEDYKAIIALDDKVLKSILASAQAALEVFFDEAVCKVTAANTIDFARMRKKRTCLFIENPTANSRVYQPLISVFFDIALRELMSKIPDKNELSIYLTLDEASTIRIEALGDILNNNRKYRCPISTLWQSSDSIDNSFGISEAESIRNASRTKIYLGPQGIKVSRELEETLGRCEEVNSQGKTVIKPLMLKEEIVGMNFEDAIIVSAHSRPLKVQVTPYFKNPYLQSKTNMPPYQFHNPTVPSTIPLISLT